ncbi:hypothetical protein N3K66_004973 [Trichothecium roseum]|uniref:Uncharacterized protein n=1 Tax=Trichothecium roseum TaxID=47278 RepID=A0ACC0V5H2_9HYPO|nr:hypothetical protein N3K66_004973 [Trichothecium roseum]
MASETIPAPWDRAAPEDQLFVLITGANSGIGLGIGERLIDEFLATRPETSHLVLLPTTRSATKSAETVRHLYAHAARSASSSPRFSTSPAAASAAAARVHVLSPQLDLCDIPAIYELADDLCTGTLSNPAGGVGGHLRGVAIPRLDSIVCNAAYGGWSGVNYAVAVWKMLTDGFVQSVTWPTFKNALPTALLNKKKGYDYPDEPLLGEVFSACVFGHYLLARRLLPLLNRPAGSALSPGRIIWSSSVEAVRDVFSASDLQAFRPGAAPYESAKRLTDVLSLTHTLPSVRKYSTPYLTADSDDSDDNNDDDQDDAVVRARMYLTHPGVVASTLFPLPWFLFWAYELSLAFARWAGSPWHTVDAYSGAKSAAYVVLQPQAALDERDAERVKWGSASDRSLAVDVKRTEVEGWGWQGRVEGGKEDGDEAGVAGVFRKSVGRKRGVVDVSEESLAEFEETGAEVWRQMEELREKWEEILDLV